VYPPVPLDCEPIDIVPVPVAIADGPIPIPPLYPFAEAPIATPLLEACAPITAANESVPLAFVEYPIAMSRVLSARDPAPNARLLWPSATEFVPIAMVSWLLVDGPWPIAIDPENAPTDAALPIQKDVGIDMFPLMFTCDGNAYCPFPTELPNVPALMFEAGSVLTALAPVASVPQYKLPLGVDFTSQDAPVKLDTCRYVVFVVPLI
jgi:hypothetical protein